MYVSMKVCIYVCEFKKIYGYEIFVPLLCMYESICMYECMYVVTQSHPEQSLLRHRTANEIPIRFERVGIHLLGDLIHIGVLDEVRRSILNLIFF